MLDGMRRRGGINPLNGNIGPDDSFMGIIVGRKMFHPDWFIDKFRSYGERTHQYQTYKYDNIDLFQNSISFFCEMEELSQLFEHVANPRGNPQDNRIGLP
jgi:hypothetical protein